MADIYGQLVKAQLENSASDLSNVAGLVYYNTSTGFAKYYDGVGAAWRSLVNTAGAQTLTDKTLTSPLVGTYLSMLAQAETRYYDSDGSNYIGLKSPATVAADKVFVLPNADGSAGQFLKTDGSLGLGWASALAVPTVGAKTASYTITDADGYGVINVTTAPSNITASSRSTDTVTMTGAHLMLTGCPVLYNGTGTAIGGLTAGVVYYAIVTSSTACKFATTIANALAGTAITLSGSATPSSTLTPGVAIILPTDSDNTNRELTVIANYTTATNSYVAVIPESGDSSTIGGAGSVLLQAKGDRVTVFCDGTDWQVTGYARKPSNARAYSTAAQAFTHGSRAVVGFDTTDYDSHSEITGTGVSWLYTAKRAKKVHVSTNIRTAADADWDTAGDNIRLEIYKNSASVAMHYFESMSTPSGSRIASCSVSTTVDMAVGDTITCRILQNTTAAGTVALSNGADDVTVSIDEVSAASVI